MLIPALLAADQAAAETIGAVGATPRTCRSQVEVLATGSPSSVNGTLTSFRFRGVSPAAGTAALQVLRPTAVANQYRVIDQVRPISNPGGSSVISVPASIKVQAGDRIGEYVISDGFPCADAATGAALQRYDDLASRPNNGAVVTITQTDTSGSNLAATIIPDALGRPNLTAASDTGSSSSDNITNVNQPTFRGSGAGPGATITLLRNGVPIGTGTANNNGVYTVVPTSALPDGAASYTVTQTVGGDTSAASPSVSVTVDTVAPSVGTSVTATTAGSPVTINGLDFYRDQANVTVNAADATSGLAQTRCTFDDGQFNVNNTPVTPGQVFGFGLEGQHILNGCTATDVAGNMATSAVQRFYVDASDPLLSALTRTPDTQPANAPVTVGFSGSDNDRQPPDATGFELPDGGGSGIVAYEVTKSGAESTTQTVQGSSGSVQVTTEGTTTVSVVAIDAVGHRSSPQSTVVVLDLTAPTASISAFTPGGKGGGVGTLTGTASDNLAVASIAVRLRSQDGSYNQTFQAVCSGCGTSSATWTLDLNGRGIPAGQQITARAQATDTAGNVGPASQPVVFATKVSSPAVVPAVARAAGAKARTHRTLKRHRTAHKRHTHR